MVRRRVRREPVAYILGRKGFRRIELAVDRRALIPRPETELLVEVALELRPRAVLDVGTGSGAVALAVADELPAARVLGTDTSLAALGLARENAAALGLADRVRFEGGTLPGGQGEAFDLVLANLPYVTDAEWGTLAPEIVDHEPRDALVAGPTGLEAIEALLDALAGGETKAAAIAFEVGLGQATRVAELLQRGRLCRGRDSAGPGGHRTRRDRPGEVTEAVTIDSQGADVARAALERCIAGGGVAIFPADGLYGLACDPSDERAIERIQALKGRDARKPSAVLFFSPLAMRELVAALGPRTRDVLGALLPGPVTVVVANPQRRYPLACREDPERLGVRLIEGPLAGARCALFQTSANRSGERAPVRFDELEPEITAGVDLAIDGGELAGLPSTVIDVTAIEAGGPWRILREGALARDEVERRLAALAG